jgi:SAM-dependent methyltransferase
MEDHERQNESNIVDTVAGSSFSTCFSSNEGVRQHEDDDDGHRHGNFKHYYEYHTASRERFEGIIPGSFLRIWRELKEPATFSILDIGCNEGDLTAELLLLVQAELPASVRCVAHGLDLDRQLVAEACARHGGVPNLHFSALDVMEGDSLRGFLAALAPQQEEEGVCVSVVSCLRVTMWVHLNHGDAGLRRLLGLLGAAAARSALLLDPQKHSYYKKACSRNAKLGSPGFPYSLDELSVGHELPERCLNYFRDEFQLSTILHKDIAKWGGTLLFMMKESGEDDVVI